MPRSCPSVFLILAFSLIAARAADKATPPEKSKGAPARVQLPDGWTSKAPPPTLKHALQYGARTEPTALFLLFAESTSDFSDKVGVIEYTKLSKKAVDKTSKLSNLQETEVKERAIGDLLIAEYESTGEANGAKVHFRTMVIRIDAWFYRVSCWTPANQWDVAQQSFDDLVRNLR
jgi:hypothetical protein